MTVTEEPIESFKETEIGTLPEDWQIKKIADMGKILTGNTPSTKHKEYYGDKYQFISPSDLGISRYVYSSGKHLSDAGLKVSRPLPKNSILVTCIGSTIGKIGMTFENQAATNQQINSIICCDAFDSHFVYYYLTFIADRIKAMASTVAVPIINKSNFSELKVISPSLTEQKKIASVLSTVKEGEEKTENVLLALKELKKSMMKHLFKYGAVSLEEADRVPLKETEIGLIPEHWEVKKLGEVSECMDSKRIPLSVENRQLRKGGIPYYGASGIIDYIDESIFDETLLLVSEDGANLRTRNLPIAYIVEGKCWINNHIHVLKVTKSHIYMLKSYLNAVSVEGYITGTTMPKLNQAMLVKIKVPFPPFQEQEQMASALLSIDDKIQAEQDKKNALNTLFKTLLSLLMTGRVRVKNIEIPA